MSRNTKILIIISVIVLLVLVLIFALNLSNKQEPEAKAISPFQPNVETSVDFGAGLSLTNPQEGNVYLYRIDYEEIEKNLSNLTSFMGESFTLIDETDLFSFYEGNNGSTIIFDRFSGMANFTFATSKDIGITQYAPNDTTTKILADLLKEIKGGDEYRLVDYTSIGREYDIKLSLVLNNILIETGATQPYSDMLRLDNQSRLTNGQISLASYTRETSVSLIPSARVGDYIEKNDAIYEFTEIDNLYIYSDQQASTQSEEIPENTEGYLGQSELLETDSCVAQKMTLIYLYKQWDQNYLFPTYKIDCLGSDTVDGKDVEVPVVVYTNAIDLDYIEVQ